MPIILLPLRQIFFMRNNWWKLLCVLLLFYTIIAGFLFKFELITQGGLLETMRNLFFHVPMWFTMTIMFFISFYYSISYLRGFDPINDIKAAEFAKVGVLFSILGMATGMEWANFTWSDIPGQRTGPWTGDPKQICAALCMLTYFAYLVLRGGIKDEEKRGRISAVYNIFACALMIPLIFIIPRMVDSLHPGGSQGNPALNPKDMTSLKRAVFYPAVIGWVLLALWFATLKIRMRLLQYRTEHYIDDNGFDLEKHAHEILH